MIAEIFDAISKEAQASRYFDPSAALRPELDRIDSFISVERFESLTAPGKTVSLSLWRDEQAAAAWRAHLQKGRTSHRRGRDLPGFPHPCGHGHARLQSQGSDGRRVDGGLTAVRTQRLKSLS